MRTIGRLCRVRSLILLTVASMVAVTGLTAAPAQAAAPHYRAVDLGLIGGATDINDHRQVVGWYVPEGTYDWRPFLWDRGRVTDLGSLSTEPGLEESQALDINNRGQVVGYSALYDWSYHAFLWENGVMTDLGTLGGTFSKAWSINDRGQIVGWSEDAAGVIHNVMWQDGVIVRIDNLGGGDINDRGQSVGGGESLWYRGHETPLGLGATAINNAGDVVGYTASGEDDPIHAYVWRRGVTTDLGTIGALGAYPADINDRGEILGLSFFEPGNEGYTVFVWRNGVMTDVTPDAHGWGYDYERMGLNNRGDFVVSTYFQGQEVFAYLR